MLIALSKCFYIIGNRCCEPRLITPYKLDWLVYVKSNFFFRGELVQNMSGLNQLVLPLKPAADRIELGRDHETSLKPMGIAEGNFYGK